MTGLFGAVRCERAAHRAMLADHQQIPGDRFIDRRRWARYVADQLSVAKQMALRVGAWPDEPPPVREGDRLCALGSHAVAHRATVPARAASPYGRIA